MKQSVIIILTIVLSFFSAREVLAVATPIERAEWNTDFQSAGAIDTGRSTIQWQRGFVSLKKEGDKYTTSGILWTKDISFRQDILSLTLDGIYDQPSGTSVLAFINYDGDMKEYSLSWGATNHPERRVRRLRLKIFLATNNQEVSPKVYKLYLRTELQDRSEAGPATRDNRRVADLKKISDIIKRYHNDFGRYPVVSSDKYNKKSQWRLLKEILDSASTNYRKNYNYGFFGQPTGVDDEYQYGYLTDGSGVHFLLWTQLEVVNSPHFQGSWKGEILGLNCSSPTYCLSSQPTTIVLEPTSRYFEDVKISNAVFVKKPNDPRVWLRLGNYRLWLRTPTIFKRLGGQWKDITLSASIDEVPLLKLVRGKNNRNVYLFTAAGFKRRLPEKMPLDFYGQPSEIVTVDDRLIDFLPDNHLIKGRGNDKIYLLDQGIKRWITSPSVLKKLGFDFSQVVEVDPRELDYYPGADPIF